MNAKTLLALTAAAIFTTCAGSLLVSQSQGPEARVARVSVTNLPTVHVAPDSADLAYYQAHARVVDLSAVQVRPDPADLAYYQATLDSRIVDLATVTVRPAAEDLAFYLASQATAGLAVR